MVGHQLQPSSGKNAELSICKNKPWGYNIHIKFECCFFLSNETKTWFPGKEKKLGRPTLFDYSFTKWKKKSKLMWNLSTYNHGFFQNLKKKKYAYLCASDCTKWRELFSETFIINTIIKIFHIKINTLKKRKKKTMVVLKHTSYCFIPCFFPLPRSNPPIMCQ